MDFTEKLKKIPNQPGVYLMKDEKDLIIYVGKAKILKNRVKQYFQNHAGHSVKVRSMVDHIADFEYIVTDTEVEALILESNLIKKHLPKYNVMLKDGKSYPYIKVSIQEKYPRVYMTRKIKKDGAKYFGPYTSAYAVKQTIEAIHSVYPIKMCNKNFDGPNNNQRPCLNYFIHQCSGVCTGTVDLKKYWEDIGDIIDILKGKDQNIIEKLMKEMNRAASNLDYEAAAKLRDQIDGIKTIGEKQKIITDQKADQDVINYAVEGEVASIQVFNIRDGKMIGRENYLLEWDFMEDTFFEEFLKRFYQEGSMIPKEILIPHPIEDQQSITDWLESKREGKVEIKVPQIGDKKRLLNLVEENARLTLFERVNKKRNEHSKIQQCKEWFDEQFEEQKNIERVEGYDISNISGKDAVGSMVVFDAYKAAKKYYRRFRIKTVEGQDDYASMKEVVGRRIKRGLEKKEDKGFAQLPDLIFVDGGIGHIHAVKEVLKEYKVDLPVWGLVKNDRHKLEKLITEEGREIAIPKGTPVYYFLHQLSEEVHRFAIEYHRKIRSRGLSSSQLEKIDGIGEKRQHLLMEHFKNIENIKKAKLEDLLSINGMDRRSANNVYDYFHEGGLH
ncbi:MAG TPA: excinuclease ABC subunit C [Eubacteriaceae bacterium]|nr:excinuclease ABC subunit C [Eubacteriaceae bacterium]